MLAYSGATAAALDRLSLREPIRAAMRLSAAPRFAERLRPVYGPRGALSKPHRLHTLSVAVFTAAMRCAR